MQIKMSNNKKLSAKELQEIKDKKAKKEKNINDKKLIKK